MPSGKMTAECMRCGKPIMKYTNRKPAGEWFHERGKLIHCWIDGNWRREDVAVPDRSTIRVPR